MELHALAKAPTIEYARRAGARQAEVITCRQLERTKILVVAIFVTHVSVRNDGSNAPYLSRGSGTHPGLPALGRGKYVDALPMLEKIVADHPSDLTAKEHWAFSMVGSAATLPDPAERKKMRARARILAVELKEAENNPGLYGLPGYAPRTYSFATSMNMFPKTP